MSADAPFAEATSDTGELSRWRRFRLAIVTPQAIYGTLLVSAIIGTAHYDESDLDVLITAVGTVLAFWIAHVFAESIAHYGTPKSIGLPMTDSFKHSLRTAAGLLYAAIVPCLFLLLGALGIMDESAAYQVSLWLPVFLLGALGWFAFADRGSVWWVRLLGSLVTGFLGVIVIILKITVH
ncbi:hypothetical protein [Subtercola lobariae]|uniref:Uncharacterized protein n=1 Tax=Subtercola lobariae TaxID=1588641 RepID=A0A917B2U3_9MICO|nr:hypothetical protein [Subtercola lobariae]GGF19846.1 hypothetical protein GCM10011399_11830 [Subtercola lobariae]